MLRLLIASTFVAVLTMSAGGAAGQASTQVSGEAVYRRACASCHSIEAGVNRSGPSLAGISDRAAGAVRQFRYSDAMSSSPVVWTDVQLDAFLTNPRGAMPGNRMAYPGLAGPEDRAAVIRYLRTLR